MWKQPGFFSPLALIAFITCAAPIAMVKGVTSVQLCINPFYQGPCTNEIGLNAGNCRHVLPPYVGQISSVLPWAGTQCILYTDPGCIGSGLVVPSIGIPDLSAFGWNDRTVSFTCFPA
ncbi:hypothetical protein HGRIS_011865 [Hohenbuehelia grisea]|uniref:Secreted protein n=1 Tax=Hohenbuehelia grisea TaxID=104357 RepID=A0ABR3JXH2_9AGAR